jgi:hypothetical protein
MNKQNLSFFLSEAEKYIEDSRLAEFQTVTSNINKMEDMIKTMQDFNIDKSKI